MHYKENSLESNIESIANKFIKEVQNKEIQIISHFDTDGITSASIAIQSLKTLDLRFSVKIIKNLEEQFIYDLSKDKIILFLDLASGSLQHLVKSNLKNIFIIDHHEISQKIPKEINIINPELNDKQKISSSGLTYLFFKEINPATKKFAKLAVLGMIGDCLEKEIDKLNYGILDDGEIKRKRGLLIYPSTRPLNRVLEYNSNPYIPEVTGNIKGVFELLKEAGINPENGKYKSLVELDKNEMEGLITAIMLKNPLSKQKEIIGDIFLIKMFDKLEDARELSAIINACSRLGEPDTAIRLCMEIQKTKKKAESIRAKYKQSIVSGLKFAKNSKKIEGEGFVIINAKNQIKETIIGTIASILSNSSVYDEGTIIIAMALDEDNGNIKISGRNVGKTGRNVREILANVIETTGGEAGGHEFAAGAIISQDKEQEFINSLKKHLELEVVKI